MPTPLGNRFIRDVTQSGPLFVEHAGRRLLIRANASDNVAVVDGDRVIGHITGYTDLESGASRASLTGLALPPTYCTLEEALDHLLAE